MFASVRNILLIVSLIVVQSALQSSFLASSASAQQAPGASTQARKPDSCSLNYNFDQLIFSIQWPLSFCYQKNDQCAIDIARKKRWMIHGLWPNRSNQKRRRSTPNNNKKYDNIEFCCGPSYQNKNITDQLFKELVDKWPTLNSNGKHHVFWRHEWQKHGTCARTIKSLNSQNAYFQTILNLYQRFDLNKAGLRNNQNYTLAQLHSAIDPIVGKKARIECSFVGAPGSKNRQSIFSEVRICLDKNLSPRDCRQGDDYQCKPPIYMP